MLCERCKKKEATTHLRESINGSVRELHLCEDCAAQLGYDKIFPVFNPFENYGMNLQDFLGSMFSQTAAQSIGSGKRCEFCGTTFEELAQSAMAGCAHCYEMFYKDLLPSIQRIHGKTRHIGKIPGTAGKALKQKKELESLKQQMSEAVAAQEFEKAAGLRDKIREIEKKVQGK